MRISGLNKCSFIAPPLIWTPVILCSTQIFLVYKIFTFFKSLFFNTHKPFGAFSLISQTDCSTAELWNQRFVFEWTLTSVNKDYTPWAAYFLMSQQFELVFNQCSPLTQHLCPRYLAVIFSTENYNKRSCFSAITQSCLNRLTTPVPRLEITSHTSCT